MNCITLIGILQHFLKDTQSCGVLEQPMTSYSTSIQEYVNVLSITLLLELPLYYALLRRSLSPRTILGLTISVNLLTHPAVVFFWSEVAVHFSWTYATYILIAEAFVFVVEGIAIIAVWKIPVRRALLASLIANFVSWTVGAYILSP